MRFKSGRNKEAPDSRPIIGACYDPSRQQIVIASADIQNTVKHLSQSDSEEEPISCSLIRVVAPGHTADTESYEGTTFSPNLSDEELNLEILTHLERTGASGPADWSRSPTGAIAITTVIPTAVDDAVNFAHQLVGVASPLGPPASVETSEGFAPFHGGSTDAARPIVRVETPMRALARFWLEGHWQQAATCRGCAFVLVDAHSCGIAFWSPERGLVHETEQEFPDDAKFSGTQPHQHASSLVVQLLTPGSLQSIGLEEISLMILGGEPKVVAALRTQLRYLAGTAPVVSAGALSAVPALNDRQEILKRVQIADLTNPDGRTVSPYEAIALGLVGNPQVLPFINLAESLEVRQQRIAEAREAARATAKTTAASRATFALIAPPIALIAFAIASTAVLNFRSASLDARLQTETARAEELSHVRALRRAAADRLAWFIDVNNQILKIRGQQPAAVSLLLDLNQRWPQQDSSWRVTTLKALGTGAIEITGVTDHEESIQKFATALEFGGGFSGVQPEIKSEAKIEALGPSPEGEPSAPHRYTFTIRATYAPFVGLSVPARPVADPTQSQFPPPAGTTPSEPAQPQTSPKSISPGEPKINERERGR